MAGKLWISDPMVKREQKKLPSCKASNFRGHVQKDIFLYTETLSYIWFFLYEHVAAAVGKSRMMENAPVNMWLSSPNKQTSLRFAGF